MIMFLKRIKNKNACTLFVVGYNKVVLEIRANEKEGRKKKSAAGLASLPCQLLFVL